MCSLFLLGKGLASLQEATLPLVTRAVKLLSVPRAAGRPLTGCFRRLQPIISQIGLHVGRGLPARPQCSNPVWKQVPKGELLQKRPSLEGLKSIIAETYLLLWKGKQFKGCFIPSKWKWYHRHGYWATRKKLLKFDTYRRHRYHEVRGPGRRPPSKWEDQSFFRPLKDSIRFW